MGILLGSVAINAMWMVASVRDCMIMYINQEYYSMFMRLAWALYFVQMQAWILLLRSYGSHKNWLDRLVMVLNSGLALYFLYQTFFGNALACSALERFILDCNKFYFLTVFLFLMIVRRVQVQYAHILDWWRCEPCQLTFIVCFSNIAIVLVTLQQPDFFANAYGYAMELAVSACVLAYATIVVLGRSTTHNSYCYSMAQTKTKNRLRAIRKIDR